jgi:ACS family tartrate transporter-like MFS transporter
LTGSSKAGLLMLAAVLLITAAATFLYGRKIDGGKVPPLTDDEPLAQEAGTATPREATP